MLSIQHRFKSDGEHGGGSRNEAVEGPKGGMVVLRGVFGAAES